MELFSKHGNHETGKPSHCNSTSALVTTSTWCNQISSRRKTLLLDNEHPITVQHPTATTAAKIEDAATHVPFPVSLPSHPFLLTTMPPSHNSKLATLTRINPQLHRTSCPFLLYLSIWFFCHPGLAPYWIPHAQRQIADTSLALFPLLERSQESQLIRDLNWQPPVKEPLNFFVLLFF